MKKLHPTAPACFIGLGAYIAAAVFFFIRPELSAIVLSGFVGACLAAAFFPQACLFLPVISRGGKAGGKVAITFDDGPDPRTTPFLLKMLARHRLKATFFVIGRNAEKYPELIKEILDAGHCIGNHTYSHDVLVMTKSGKKLQQEIDSAQEVLKKSGIIPLAFRPPAGAVNPKLGALLRHREMICIHYSCRGPDIGNRYIRGLSEKILKKIRPGDIVLLHDSCPDPRDFKVDQWLDEIGKILEAVSRRKGLRIVPLEEQIRHPIMLKLE